MRTPGRHRRNSKVSWAVVTILVWSGCGDGGTGPEEVQTGATLQGQVILLSAQANHDGGPIFVGSGGSSALAGFAPISDVKVTIGGRSTRTDGNGSFILPNIPLGDQMVVFSGSGITSGYSLDGIVQDETYLLNEVQLGPGSVKTEHTGTWVGTGGSSEAGSQGQIAFTVVIEVNGNSLSGTGQVGSPDNTIWSMTGKETGLSVEGELVLVSSNSTCATGATYTGTFLADTLSADFVEVNPPAGCGVPESGTFTVVKQ